MKPSAQTSFKLRRGIVPVVLIIVVAVAALIVIGIATGALKGSFTATKNESQTKEETQTPDKKTPSPSPTPQAPTLSKTYTNSKLKIQINYPQNWTVNEDSKGANIYAPGTDVTSAAKSDAALIITSSPLGTLKGLQLATIADVLKNQIGESFLPGATIKSSSATTVSGQEAYVFRLDYYNEGQNYPSEFYILIDQENLYGVITSVSETKKSTYEETLKAAVDTFKIL
ncbi:MAG: PsbP-related protein [Candidatus Curtissbacteria bacterium]|nr:PsbP-related protein [Candidatus Curtissbacteria bacterium]